MIWIKTLLMNKYTWILLIIVSIVLFYNVKIMGLNSELNTRTVQYNKLYKNYTTLSGQYDKLEIDLNQTIETNNNNIRTLNAYKIDFAKIQQVAVLQNDTCNADIEILLQTINDLKTLPKPDYSETGSINVEECIVMITDGGDEYAKQKLIDISNIGK